MSVFSFILSFFTLLFFLPEHTNTPWPQTKITPKTKITYVKVKNKTMKVKPVRFSDLPHWRQDDHLAAFKAFKLSCDKYLNDKAKNPSRINHKRLNLCKRTRSAAIYHKNQARHFEGYLNGIDIISYVCSGTGD